MVKNLHSRRNFLKQAGIGAASLVLPNSRCASDIQEPRTQPNILFIMLDDLGKEWVSCYGAEEMETPNLDSLAGGGMRFRNAYSMPQCTPTRVSLLTGQYPWRHGWVNHWDVPRWGAGCHFDWNHYTTFARILKSAGYATAAAGKWQVNDFRVQPEAMVRHGFDDYCMWTGFESQNPPSANRYWDPYIHTKEGSKTYPDRFGEDVFTDFLIDFMTGNRDKPMMLYYPLCLPHGPLTTTPLDREAQGKKPLFRAMVRYADHIVGRIIKTLEDLTLRDHTIVCVTTDNGTARSISTRMNGREVHGGKATIGEPGVCEPFIVNCPGLVPAGAVTDALTDFTDMLPTFAELGGAQVPEGLTVDGHSIAPVILGKEKDSPRDWILAMGSNPAKLTERGVEPAVAFKERAIRDARYKLWVNTDRQSEKFFDLRADPGETNNLIDNQDPDRVAAREKLEAVVETLPDQDPRPKYDPTPAQPWDMTPEKMEERRRG